MPRRQRAARAARRPRRRTLMTRPPGRAGGALRTLFFSSLAGGAGEGFHFPARLPPWPASLAVARRPGVAATPAQASPTRSRSDESERRARPGSDPALAQAGRLHDLDLARTPPAGLARGPGSLCRWQAFFGNEIGSVGPPRPAGGPGMLSGLEQGP